MTYDIKIDNHKVFTIKEVPPGQLYILKGTVERGSKLKAIHCVRRRTGLMGIVQLRLKSEEGGI